MKRALILGDIHAPYHDKRALRLVQSLPDFDYVVQVGDFLDCGTISKHGPSPEKLLTFNEEVKTGRALLSILSKKAPKRVLLEGNHESRLLKYVAQKAPELTGYVPSLHDTLDPNGEWEHVPYGELYKLGKLYITHDQNFAGADGALKTRALLGHSVVIGHSHHLTSHYTGHIDGKRYVAVATGWLGSHNAPVFKYAKPAERARWQLGFSVAYIQPSLTFVTTHPIVNYRTVFEGKTYGV